MGLFDSIKNLAADGLGGVLGDVTNAVGGNFDLGAIGDLPAAIGEQFNADQLGDIQNLVGDTVNAEQLGDLQALATEHIPVDQITEVAGLIQNQAGNLDLASIAEQVNLPTDVVGQIAGLLGR